MKENATLFALLGPSWRPTNASYVTSRVRHARLITVILVCRVMEATAIILSFTATVASKSANMASMVIGRRPFVPHASIRVKPALKTLGSA